ncbi:CUB and sushi domain-containing protein 1-like [Patiria miniata]|uniref:Uncharacterized protein n=1 Tax=Patiria miniata TaxID=46514 RepID=A0A914BAN5_PATMI|nr:CUB and sushi domain-containing protein 1-like [Patiria miniata]
MHYGEPNLIKVAANDSAIISSPSYPSNYQNNQDIQWVIQTAENFRILLSFKAFSTESCCDHLSVGDGMDSANYSTRIFRSSGSSLPPDTLSAGNAMWLRFTSDSTATRSGFSLSARSYGSVGCVLNSCLSGTCQPVGRSGFNCECLDGFEGTRCETGLINLAANQSINITSPSFLSNYQDSLDIQWVIQTAEDQRIILSFHAFNTENCCDRLSAGDGIDWTNFSTTIIRLHGNIFLSDTPSTGNVMWLRFTSYRGLFSTNFSLSARSVGPMIGCIMNSCLNNKTCHPVGRSGFKCECPDGVGGTRCKKELINLAANQSINITSPSYPSNYQNNLDIEWVIQTAEDFSIILTFYDFNTWYHDIVGVGNGLASTDSSTTVFRRGGNVLPPDTLSTGNAMWLTFTTDGSENSKGFSLSARSIGAIGCILNSCLNRGTCQPVGKSGFNCECPGGFEGTRCEIELIYLAANQSINITSPSYPWYYENNLDIQWLIQAADDQKIILRFHDFDTLYYDFLEVGNGRKSTVSSTTVFRRSGSRLPPVTLSTGNAMWLRFTSGAIGIGRGFSLSARSYHGSIGCILNSCLNSGTCQPVGRSGFNCECLDGFEGTRCEIELIYLAANQSINITSPSYPSNYQDSLDIQWLIQAAEGQRIIISFHTFRTYLSDYLEVGNGRNSTDSSTRVLRLSGSRLPPDTPSTGIAMWLRFTSDGSLNRKGFSLSARSYGSIATVTIPTATTTTATATTTSRAATKIVDEGCSAPPRLNHVTIAEGQDHAFQPGEVATFTCSGGFVVTGTDRHDAERVCQSDGSWSSKPVKCSPADDPRAYDTLVGKAAGGAAAGGVVFVVILLLVVLLIRRRWRKNNNQRAVQAPDIALMSSYNTYKD